MRTTFPLTPLDNLPGLVATLLDQKVSFLLDSGCSYNIINGPLLDSILHRTQISLPAFHHSVRLQAHNNTNLSLRKDGILLPLTFSSSSGPQFMSIPFLVESSESIDTVNIIGSSFMTHKRMVLDISRLKLYISCPHESPPPDDLNLDSSFSLSVIPFKYIADPENLKPCKFSYFCKIPLYPTLRVPCSSYLGPATSVTGFMQQKQVVHPPLTCSPGTAGPTSWFRGVIIMTSHPRYFVPRVLSNLNPVSNYP